VSSVWARATDAVRRWRENLDPEHRKFLEALAEVEGQMSPDGWRYLRLADGEPVPIPYHLRWLLPRLVGSDRKRWGIVQHASLAALTIAMRAYTGTWSSAALVLTLPGVSTINRRHPVLVDLPAMTLAVASAAAVKRGQWGLGAVLSLAGGATKESAPIFAAVYAWNPLPLVGLAAPALRYRTPAGDDGIADFSKACLDQPWAMAWFTRREHLTDPKVWLAPWGALLAGFTWNPQTLLTLALAYAQCLRAVDNARLYQWAAPVVAANVTRELPRSTWLPIALATAFNPWRGEGG
jgi:hypothetical protein